MSWIYYRRMPRDALSVISAAIGSEERILRSGIIALWLNLAFHVNIHNFLYTIYNLETLQGNKDN